MAKSKKLDQKSSRNKLSFRCIKAFKDARHEKRIEHSEKKEWKNALCSVCMEYPHNAVLLLCSSYENGCRPYMCATSHRYSNCLEQYKKAHFGLLCPLCRGQVKGWTVVEPARKYLNSKKRTCMHDNCSFVGNYKGLRKHVKSEHPFARPRDVDPTQAKKWKELENKRELDDVFSTIASTMPGAIVMGDYVMESGFSSDFSDDDDDDDDFGVSRFPSDFSDDDDVFRLPRRWDDDYVAHSSRRVGNHNSSRNPPAQNASLLAGRRVGRLRGNTR